MGRREVEREGGRRRGKEGRQKEVERAVERRGEGEKKNRTMCKHSIPVDV